MRRRNLAMFATSLSQIWKCIWEIIAVRYIIHVKYANRDSSTSLLLWPTNKENMERKISNAKYASRCFSVNLTYKDIPEKSTHKETLLSAHTKKLKTKISNASYATKCLDIILIYKTILKESTHKEISEIFWALDAYIHNLS